MALKSEPTNASAALSITWTRLREPGHKTATSHTKLLKYCFCLDQLAIIHAFLKLDTHSIQNPYGLIHFIEWFPESRQAGGGSELQHGGMLILRNLQGFTKALFCCLD